MIRIENTGVYGFEAAIRGMRNPMNSWNQSDSHVCACADGFFDCPMVLNHDEPAKECDPDKYNFCVGEKDFCLMKKLAVAGPDHGKFLRMITATADITAPLYWYKEYDTYKVGTVANSCSTMHKIADKPFTLYDFSYEHLAGEYLNSLQETIRLLNSAREMYLWEKRQKEHLVSPKDYWWQLIQLLPSSYNQRRTVMLNYAVMKNIYHARKGHKLDEWNQFCQWIEGLPYSELITDNGHEEL